MDALLRPTPAEEFYARVLTELVEDDLLFMVAGGYAYAEITDIQRATKDLDIFTTPEEFPRLVERMVSRGHSVEVTDERWLGKIYFGEEFVDVIFALAGGTIPITEDWFRYAGEIDLFGVTVPIIDPTEIIWSKAFVQDRFRHDASDIAHVILRQSDVIDWQRLLDHAGPHWEIILGHLLTFRWVYPGESHRIPRWLMEELLDRLRDQLDSAPPSPKLCRGRLLSPTDYRHDIEQWGFSNGSTRADPRGQ